MHRPEGRARMGTGLHGETAISGGKKPMGEVPPPIQDRPETEPNDAGQPGSDQLMAMVYDELRALAAAYMKGERAGHTLQPTALVHEAYMRLAGLKKINWKDRTHFHAAAAGAIRRVLVDHARGAQHLVVIGFDRGRPKSRAHGNDFGTVPRHRAAGRAYGLGHRQRGVGVDDFDLHGLLPPFQSRRARRVAAVAASSISPAAVMITP